MPIPALEVPWFPLLLSLSGHDIIKASGSCEVSTLHSQRCSRSSVLSSKEQTQASAFSGLSEVSFRARVCRAICCRHWGCPCRAGTGQGQRRAQQALHLGVLPPHSRAWFGLGALANLHWLALTFCQPCTGHLYLPGLERGFNSDGWHDYPNCLLRYRAARRLNATKQWKCKLLLTSDTMHLSFQCLISQSYLAKKIKSFAVFSFCLLEKCVIGLSNGYYFTAFFTSLTPFKDI